MNKTTRVLLLTATLTLLGCSDSTGPEIVGEVIFPSIEEVDFGEIVMEREGRTIEVRGTLSSPCGGCSPSGVVELHKNQLTVSITLSINDGHDLPLPFAFRARIPDLEPGFYEVRVVYDGTGGHREPTVVFTDTAVID